MKHKKTQGKNNQITYCNSNLPQDVFRKYREKYTRFSTGHFSFTNAQNGNKTIHMNR